MSTARSNPKAKRKTAAKLPTPPQHLGVVEGHDRSSIAARRFIKTPSFPDGHFFAYSHRGPSAVGGSATCRVRHRQTIFARIY